MSEGFARQTVVITNPQGLHLRPADLFVRTAKRFSAKIEVIRDSERVDAKSFLAVLTLVAVKGTQLSIEATGEDAEDAVATLVDLVQQGFPEGALE